MKSWNKWTHRKYDAVNKITFPILKLLNRKKGEKLDFKVLIM